MAEVESGLYQIRLPIPIRSLGYVYTYFVQDGGQSLLIDSGWPSEEAYDVLQRSLSSIGVALNRIDQVVVSHLHPDHFGLAEQIKEMNPDSKLIMHKADASMILERYDNYQGFTKELHEWLAEHGTPKQELEAMIEVSSEMLHFFRPPKPNLIVSGGERINVGSKWSFEVIPTPGHTIGTLCLYDHNGSRILFSGDHILPTITPNVSLGPFYKGDPLGDYLNSLDVVDKLDVQKVIPSHEYIFSNIHRRVREIKNHHIERLSDATHVLEDHRKEKDAMSGYEIASKLHWYSGSWEELGPWERRAAVMETLAHLEYLKRKGKITEISELVDGEPRVEYAIVGNPC